MRLIVLGMMGGTPFAGVAWQTLHYLEGFRRLGCDVWYLEDTRTWPYDPERNSITDCSGNAMRYLARMMDWVGLGQRWTYVSVQGEAVGPASGRTGELLSTADMLVNLSGATELRESHLKVPTRIYLETDPVLRQIEVARGRDFTIDLLSAHTSHFSYGENLGAPDCGVPLSRFSWRPTRQPVVLDWWGSARGSGHSSYTTVANWKQTGKDIQWQGETYYWSKHLEFEKLIGLPRRTEARLELALSCREPEAMSRLRSHGWHIRDALELTRDIEPYRRYLMGSRGEFTVAKDQNVRLRSGWFSDRSASYLAAGKPVVTQDTGFGSVIPTGAGLFAFQTEEEAVSALAEIELDYSSHSAAARELAAEYFDAERVLSRLLEDSVSRS